MPPLMGLQPSVPVGEDLRFGLDLAFERRRIVTVELRDRRSLSSRGVMTGTLADFFISLIREGFLAYQAGLLGKIANIHMKTFLHR